jgi:hypothetical protein
MNNSFQNGSINPGIISGFVTDKFSLESIAAAQSLRALF